MEFRRYILLRVFTVKISGENKNVFRFWFVRIKTNVLIREEKGVVALKKNSGGNFSRAYKYIIRAPIWQLLY